jgi:cysteine-rich repeat protein
LVAAHFGCSGIPANGPRENCAIVGDEDGNGLADCNDPACRSLPVCRAVCGNGVLEAGEACDDGNTIDGDGCDHNCTITGCGNRIATTGEACDDGNTIDGDGCDHNCTITGCGNGIATTGEACDDGNTIDGDGCDHDCSVSACGNGIVAGGEACDDGNTVDGDGCDASCQFAACSSEVPATAGGGNSFPIAGQIEKLIAAPNSCLVYALDTGSPSHLVVISTASKHELTRVTLPRAATDLAVSPNGAYVVVTHDDAQAISVIDTAAWRVAMQVPSFADPYAVAVTNDGIAFYTEFQLGVHRLDLRDGMGDGPGGALLFYADIAQSRDGHSIFVGSAGTSGSNFARYDITSGIMVLADESHYNEFGGGGFYFPARHVYPSPSGQHVYYADRQFDAGALDSIRGRTGELVYAEDLQGKFAVGSDHVFDAELVRPVATLAHAASTAVLTAADQELWYYSADTGRLYYQNTQDLTGGVSFGVREIEPEPLTSYQFAKLIHDPVRPRLYGIDAGHGAVVVIDAATLQPVRAILVGGVPSDATIDATGTTLFVGNDEVLAFARIALDTLTFERFVPTTRFPARLAWVGNDRLMTIDQGFPTLLDARTGAIVSQVDQVIGGNAMGVTADGSSVFVGQSGPNYGDLFRYSLATGALVAADRSHYMIFGFFDAERSVTVVPDGSGVYYARHFLDGHDLSVVPYAADGPILAVSPDSRLALSANSVYDVASGAQLGALPAAALALAISPDGTTASSAPPPES